MRYLVFLTLLTASPLALMGQSPGPTFREKALEAAKAGDNEAAILNYEQALNSTLKVFKDDHVEVITARLELGEAYRAVGRWDDAIGQLDYVWKRARYDAEQNKRWDGEEGHLAYAAGEKLGRSLQGAGRYADAAVVFATTVSDGEKSGRQVTQLLTMDALLADTLLLVDRVPDAEQVITRARGRIMTNFANVAEAKVKMLSTLVTLYHHHRQHARALPLAQETADIAIKGLPADHPLTALALSNLGSTALHVEGRREDAIRALKGAQQIYAKKLGPDAQELMGIELNISQAEAQKKNYKDAEQHGMNALRVARLHFSPDSLEVAQCLHNLANCYLELRQPGKASDLYATALAAMEKNLGQDHPQTVDTKKMLDAARKMAAQGE